MTELRRSSRQDGGTIDQGFEGSKLGRCPQSIELRSNFVPGAFRQKPWSHRSIYRIAETSAIMREAIWFGGSAHVGSNFEVDEGISGRRSMTEFKHTVKQSGDTLHLAFEGAIDEDTEFPSLNLTLAKKVVIDLNGIRTINSVGIREWLAWIRPVAQVAEITVERCPKAMVLQFNMVDGFLPPKTKVTSFYVPYFCEKCDYEGSHLLTVGKDIVNQPGGVKVNFDAKGAAKCADGACEIEMDVSEAKYFQFLKRL